MNQQELLKTVADAPLQELGPLLKLLAKRLYLRRREHNGFVPREIFESCIGIGGIAVAIEVVPMITENNEHYFALRMRGSPDELGWGELYHIPGATARQNIGAEPLFQKLAEEICGKGASRTSIEKLTFTGVTIQNEPERLNTCWTVVYTCNLDRKLLDPTATWCYIQTAADMEKYDIVDHHRATLTWVMDAHRQLLADLRLHEHSDWLTFLKE